MRDKLKHTVSHTKAVCDKHERRVYRAPRENMNLLRGMPVSE